MLPTRGLTVAVSLLATLALGCGGGDQRDTLVPASGTVTYGGEPVKSGTIAFVPEKGHAAEGKIVDGKFTISTYEDNDGAVAGKHRVGVMAMEEVPVKKAANGEEATVKWIVPEKFANPDSSGLEIEVPADGTSDLKIDVPK